MIKPGDSLESILYGVFETIQKWEHPDCETCNFFREAYRSMKDDAQWKMVHKAWKHRALVSALEDWVRIPMEYIMIEKIKKYIGVHRETMLRFLEEKQITFSPNGSKYCSHFSASKKLGIKKTSP